jgi:hypothetical protein
MAVKSNSQAEADVAAKARGRAAAVAAVEAVEPDVPTTKARVEEVLAQRLEHVGGALSRDICMLSALTTRIR